MDSSVFRAPEPTVDLPNETVSPVLPSEALQVSDIMESTSTVVTSSVGWVREFSSFVLDTPLLLAFFLVLFVGLGVGLIRRIIR